MSDLTELSLTDAARRLRQRSLTAWELARACLNQIGALDKEINAWETICEEQALEAAAECDADAAKGLYRGPLHGIPVGVKDVFLTAGVRTSAGSSVYADFVPEKDATVVQRLKSAGAIILGKTITTELAYLDPAKTRNPWNLEHTPGGSSSGSAAAVAARMCFAALGTQTLGSTIRPAAYCGIVGLKPTYGRISRYGMIPLAQGLDHVGIFARTVADAALILEVLAGPDPNDPSCSAMPVPAYTGELVRVERIKIGLLKDPFVDRADGDVKAFVLDAVDRFAKAGAQIKILKPPASLDEVPHALSVKLAFEAALSGREILQKHRARLGPNIRELLERGTVISSEEYQRSEEVRVSFKQEINELFSQADCLLLPATPTTAPRGLKSTGDPAFIAPWTFAGLPQITIPVGLGRNGLPVGVQLIASEFEEAKLIGCARWCESVIDFTHKPRLGKS